MYAARVRPYEVAQRNNDDSCHKSCDSSRFGCPRPAEYSKHAGEKLSDKAVCHQQNIYKLCRICKRQRISHQKYYHEENLSLNFSLFFGRDIPCRSNDIVCKCKCRRMKLRLCRALSCRKYTCSQKSHHPPRQVLHAERKRHLVCIPVVALKCKHTYKADYKHRDHYKVKQRHIGVLFSYCILVLASGSPYPELRPEREYGNYN